jgi:phage recombination protein Bet
MSNNITTIKPQELTTEDVKKYLCAEATDKEIFMFLQIAKNCNLNPFLKEIYLVKYGTQPATILTSYNVYLQRAERSGSYAGLETSTVGSVSTGDLKAVVKVFRKDWTQPLTHEVYYEEYVQKTKDGSPNRFWKEKPRTMIVKVAISQAFRLAFPLDFQGMPYTNDEINTIDTLPDVKGSPDASNSTVIAPTIEEQPKNEPNNTFPVTQEELTEMISIAVKNQYTPAEILAKFENLGYKIEGKITKSLNVADIKPFFIRWDYEDMVKELSEVKK